MVTERRRRRRYWGALGWALVVLGASAPAWAVPQRPAGDDPAAPVIRERLQQLYLRQLRTHLGLSDEQLAAIEPHLQEIDRVRQESQRELRALRHELTRALRDGSSDDVLQGLLDRMDEVRERQRLAVRESSARIDRELTVRQRVQWRVVTERFQREVRRRIGEIRGGRPDRRRSGVGRPSPGGRFR